MADNDYVNKVELSDGSTLIDLTGDTATASDVVRGKTLHLASGALATGTFDMNQFVQKSGDVMTGNLEFQRITHKRFQLFDGDTLEYECVVENDNAASATYDTSMDEIGSYSLVDNISYTSVNFSEDDSIVAWAQVRMSDSIVDIEPGEYTPRSAGHGDALESPKLVVSAFSMEAALSLGTDGTISVVSEQAYPIFTRSNWSELSDESMLPTTPCIVIDTSKVAFYFCSGE